MSIGDDPEKKAKLQEEARKVLESLSDQEKRNFRENFGIEIDSLSLEQIAEKFDSIRERIREVERKAIEKLNKRKDPEEPA